MLTVCVCEDLIRATLHDSPTHLYWQTTTTTTTTTWEACPPFKDPDIPCSTSISYTIGEFHAETEWLWLIVLSSADYTVCFLMFLSRRRPNMARTSVLTNDYPVTLRLQPPGSPGLIPRPARVRWILSPSRVLIRKFSFKMQKPWKESHDHNNIATVCWPKSYSESIRFDLPF